jgi:histidinol-phosphatase (PHP family)
LTPQDLYKTYLDFLTEAHRLKVFYAQSITLLVGIETDYITELDLTGLENLLKVERERIQFVVGSVHHVRSIPIDFDRPTWEVAIQACGSSTTDLKSFFLDYLDEQYTMLQRIKPTVVGHFDLCRLFSPGTRLDGDKEVWDKVERNVKFVIEYGGLFEVNAASFRKGWDQAYPGAEVLQVSPCVNPS